MKSFEQKRLLLTGIVLVFAFGMQACKKKYIAPVMTATLNGNYSFSASITASNLYGQITLIATQSGTPIKDIEIHVTANAAGTYSLNSSNGINTGMYIEGPNTSNLIKYETNASNTGTISFSKMDLSRQLMSGTFSFNALEFFPTAGTATVTVTNGSFTDVPWQ